MPVGGCLQPEISGVADKRAGVAEWVLYRLTASGVWRQEANQHVAGARVVAGAARRGMARGEKWSEDERGRGGPSEAVGSCPTIAWVPLPPSHPTFPQPPRARRQPIFACLIISPFDLSTAAINLDSSLCHQPSPLPRCCPMRACSLGCRPIRPYPCGFRHPVPSLLTRWTSWAALLQLVAPACKGMIRNNPARHALPATS